MNIHKIAHLYCFDDDKVTSWIAPFVSSRIHSHPRSPRVWCWDAAPKLSCVIGAYRSDDRVLSAGFLRKRRQIADGGKRRRERELRCQGKKGGIVKKFNLWSPTKLTYIYEVINIFRKKRKKRHKQQKWNQLIKTTLMRNEDWWAGTSSIERRKK